MIMSEQELRIKVITKVLNELKSKKNSTTMKDNDYKKKE